jgi:hypothetical protein
MVYGRLEIKGGDRMFKDFDEFMFWVDVAKAKKEKQDKEKLRKNEAKNSNKIRKKAKSK